MAVWNTVKLTAINDNFGRLDAEFFRSDNLYANNQVTSKKHENLGRLVLEGCRVVYENTKILTHDKITDKCARFLQATNISPNGLSIDLQNIGFVHEKDWIRYPKGRIAKGQLLIEVKGQAEKVAIVPEEFPMHTLVSGSLFKLTIDHSKISPWYVFLYLSTRYGKLLRNRLKVNTLIGFVSQPQLYSIPVFLPNNQDHKEISVLVEDAFRYRSLSEKLYTRAQQLLEAEIGLDKLSYQDSAGCTSQFSETITSGRIDADYFQPQYAAVRAVVQNYSGGYEPLLNCAESLRPNIDPLKAPKQLFNYIELSNINASIGIVEDSLLSLGANLPSRAKRKVKMGDIIASAVVGSIEKAAIIAKEQDGFLASTGFFHFIPKGISSEYLLMLIRSRCVRMQFQQQSTGIILSAVTDRRLKYILIPKVPKSLQEKITKLVSDSHSAKRKSEELLEKAKNRVEQLIEEATKL